MRTLLKCRKGATAIEYGLFAALAALVLSSGVTTIGERIGGTFATAAGAMAASPADAALARESGRARHLVIDEHGGVREADERN